MAVFAALWYLALEIAPDRFSAAAPAWFDFDACRDAREPETVKNCLDAYKARTDSRRGVTTATLALFAGALSAIGAFYTARTFAQNRKDTDRRHQLELKALTTNREEADRRHQLELEALTTNREEADRRHQLELEAQGRDQNRLVTERFTRAIDQLGETDKLDVRLGGIYALERIARDSAEDHPQIVEVLTAYIRGHAPWRWRDPGDEPVDAPELPSDLQAAMSVLGRRTTSHDTDGLELNLPNTDLRRLNLRSADAQLAKVNLQSASLDQAVLPGAILRDAHLLLTSLREAWLNEADLRGSNLTSADLRGAYLVNADLRNATLRARFSGARLYGADLRADLDGIDLHGAAYDADTKWPEGFDPRTHGAQFYDDVDKSQYLKR